MGAVSLLSIWPLPASLPLLPAPLRFGSGTAGEADGAGDAVVDRRWVERARAGDRDAFGELVRRHERRVFRLASRFFRRREDVDDVAQEVFLRVWRRLGEFRGEAPFEHWLTRVALNTCHDQLRRDAARAARRTESLDAPIEGDRESLLRRARRETGERAPGEAIEARLEVERLLDTLPPTDRFLLLMLHGEGRTVEEISARLGWSKANVKVRAFRARQRLKRLLEASAEKEGTSR